MNDFVPALLKEMDRRRDYLGDRSVQTVYLGGGTPSLLSPAAINTILEHIRRHFTVGPDPEITLEANPDDMTDRGQLIAWHAAGITRLSIGVQSFFDADLRWMNRAHQAQQARESIRLAQEAGFDNLSIDLIYGGPTLPDDHWEANVREAIRFGIPHLSCYALTVEPRTALDKLIRQHKQDEVSADDQARQLLLLMDWMTDAGYEHYEISNFARPGRRSRHNSAYWQGTTYLGLGPSAHSYDGLSRQWNIANNAKYMAAMTLADPLPSLVAGKEMLTGVQQFNEYVMLALRTTEGLDSRQMKGRFGDQAVQGIIKRIEPYVLHGKAVMTDDRIFLTPEGKLLADRIAADLFYDVLPGES